MASIRKRKDRKGTRWIVDCRGIPGGRRLTFKTREEAELARADTVKASQQAQPTARDRDITLDAYADRWLEQITVSVETNTSASYRQNLSKHVRPTFGPMKLRDLHRGHIKALLAKKRQDGLSKNSVRLVRAVLSVMLGDAVDDGVLQVNPAVGTGRRGRKRPDTITSTERQHAIRVMDYEQLAAFLRCTAARCSRRADVLFKLYIDAGLRPGEGCGVQWRDVDAIGKTLRVERAVTNAGRIKTTKTGEARTVDLTPRLVGALTALQTELEAEALLAGRNGIEPWVVADLTGRPLRPQRVGRVFHRIVQAAGLPRFVLYDLRHTYASHLIAQGADPGYVARQMGHRSMVTTLSFYGHWFPKSDRRYVERMEEVRAAAVDEAPIVHDDVRLPLDSEVNEDSWHRFGTGGDQLEMGAMEVIELSGAEGGTRTPTPLRAHDPESCASANSATSAGKASLGYRASP